MTEVTIPVPYSGGTINTGQTNGFCYLTENRYLEVFFQINPGYVFAKVIGVDNPRAATPVVTTLRTQALNELASRPINSLTLFKLARINSTTALLVYTYVNATSGIIARSITVDPVTNQVTLGPELVLSTLNTVFVGNNTYSSISIQSVTDGIVLVSHFTNSTTMQISKCTLGVDGIAITAVALVTYPVTQAGSFTINSVSFMRVRNSQQWVAVVHYVTSGNSLSGATDLATKLFYGDPTSNSAWTAITNTYNSHWSQPYLPTSATTGLLIDPALQGTGGIVSWAPVVNGTLGNTTVFSSTPAAGYPQPQWATWIGSNDDHMIVFGASRQSAQNLSVNNGQTGFRVIKYVDGTYGKVSPSTSTAAGGSLGAVAIAGYTYKITPTKLADDLIVFPTYLTTSCSGNSMKLLFIKV